MAHIERKSELRRRRKRKEKLHKLTERLRNATHVEEARTVLAKIRRISPLWQPPPDLELPEGLV